MTWKTKVGACILQIYTLKVDILKVDAILEGVTMPDRERPGRPEPWSAAWRRLARRRFTLREDDLVIISGPSTQRKGIADRGASRPREDGDRPGPGRG